MVNGADIQGIAPARVERIETAADLPPLIRRCVEDGRKIIDYGTLHRGYGLAPPDHIQLQLPSGVVEHHVSDMTVTVRAGTTLHDLAAALAKHKQWLPIDGADDSLTVGEMVAHNLSGPLRLAFGGMRRLLLGLSFVNWQGETITVGGRTVKNVAGYDLTRFMVGNMNMLGVVTELTLRTYAVPEQVTRVALPGARIELLDPNVTELLTSEAAPIYIDHQHSEDEGEMLYMAYAGDGAQCAAQFHALRSWLPNISYNPRESGALRDDGSLWEDARSRAERRAWRIDADAWVKLIVPPGRAGQTVTELIELNLPPRTVIESLPGHGVVHLGGAWSIADARQYDPLMLRIVGQWGGMRVWMRRPENTLRVDPFTPTPPDWPMLDRVMHAIDPWRVFNPGRLGAMQELSHQQPLGM